MPGRKATFQAIPNPEEFDAALDELLSVLDHSIKLLSVVREKHPDLAATAKTCLDIRAKLYQWTQPDRLGNNALKRSEEYTSELQSLMRISYAFFCLKKKNYELTVIASTLVTLNK